MGVLWGPELLSEGIQYLLGVSKQLLPLLILGRPEIHLLAPNIDLVPSVLLVIHLYVSRLLLGQWRGKSCQRLTNRSRFCVVAGLQARVDILCSVILWNVVSLAVRYR